MAKKNKVKYDHIKVGPISLTLKIDVKNIKKRNVYINEKLTSYDYIYDLWINGKKVERYANEIAWNVKNKNELKKYIIKQFQR